MAKILYGEPVAEALSAETAARAARLRARGVTPTLAIIRVGERPDDMSYERGAVKRCLALGIEVRKYTLRADAAQTELMAAIDGVNRDDGIHGCLLLRPLPGQMDEHASCEALAAEKDVDCITAASLCGVFTGDKLRFAPCTARACIEMLDYYGIAIAGKRAAVIGRSLVVGRPAAMLLLERDATVTICHSKTPDAPAICREADILIAASGRAGLVGSEYLRSGQTVIDVGINPSPDGGVCGDVNFAEAEAVIGAITPVPRGVGSVTTAVLCRHVVEAAERAAGY